MINHPEQEQYRWTPPEGYYQDIASSNVNVPLHWFARKVVGSAVAVRFGAPKVYATQGVIDADFSDGNVIVAATHRHLLDTITFPDAIEKVGIHHARPMSKIELFQHPVPRWFFHEVGAFCVNRKNSDINGLAEAQRGILQRGGVVTIYGEGTRVTHDVLTVPALKSGLILTAAANDSIIVPAAVAGLSVEKENKRTVARDARSWLGLGPRLHFAFGDPLKVALPYPDADLRALNRQQRNEQTLAIRFESNRVREAMQAVLSAAYAIRGATPEPIN